ncbi:MAG: YibE/F family protein [Actinomycetaceae bacterium]|nr:YibE/F family protein [Actinomycetaceae bacterium]
MVKRRRVQVILACIVIPLLLATLVGLFALWPKDTSKVRSLPIIGADSSVAEGTVSDLHVAKCKPKELSHIDDSVLGTPELADKKRVLGLAPGADLTGDSLRESIIQDLGTDAASISLLRFAVCAKVTKGEGRGQVMPVSVPREVLANGISVGDRIQMIYNPSSRAQGTAYHFWDFKRGYEVGFLAFLYVALVLAVARLKGGAALVGLLGSVGVIGVFTVPSLLDAHSPLLVAIVSASAMMFISVYLAHGISIRTTTALLGTFAGLVITFLLAAWGVSASNLTGASEEITLGLVAELRGLSLQQILLAGMVVAGLGALNDVTITQASSVWELHAANPRMSRRAIWVSAMRIGSDHIASTVYTLAFAFVGAGLPLIMYAFMTDRPALDTLLSASIAEEVVRTLVASIGLIASIPLTTAVGAALVHVAPRKAETQELA